MRGWSENVHFQGDLPYEGRVKEEGAWLIFWREVHTPLHTMLSLFQLGWTFHELFLVLN